MLGSGMMATALRVPLTENGHEVRLVGTFLDRDIIDGIDADRSHPRLDRPVPAEVGAYRLEDLEEAIAKGMEANDEGDLRVLTEVLAERIPTGVWEVVPWSGIVRPPIAGEAAARRDTCVLFAGPDHWALDDMADLFRTERYHVWTSTDLVGAEVCAAMKNCFALGVGLAEGVRTARGEAERPDRNHIYEAGLFAQGAVEIRQMVELVGGDPATVDQGLPSVGEMFVTSTGGRNVRVGRLMGEGIPFTKASEQLGNPTLEGAAAITAIGGALEPLTARGKIQPEDFPHGDGVGLRRQLSMEAAVRPRERAGGHDA